MYNKGRHGLLSQEPMDHLNEQTDLVRDHSGWWGSLFNQLSLRGEIKLVRGSPGPGEKWAHVPGTVSLSVVPWLHSWAWTSQSVFREFSPYNK